MSLVVTGMHRSGTSAVARVVDALGLSRGAGEVMGPAPDNPRGFFERRDVAALNDRWLDDLGGSWWAPPRPAPAWWRSLDEDHLRSDRRSLDFLSPTEPPWYVKDPRISLLLPLWDRLALQRLPVILVSRDPREVAASLSLRDGVTPRRALALWYHYNRLVLEALDQRDAVVIDYGRLLKEPTSGVQAIAEFVRGVSGSLPGTVELDELLALVEADLKRQTEPDLEGSPPSVVAEAIEAHDSLLKLHGRTPRDADLTWPVPDWVEEALEELRELWLTQQSVRAAEDAALGLQERLRRAEEEAAQVDVQRRDHSEVQSRLLLAEQRVEDSARVAADQRDELMQSRARLLELEAVARVAEREVALFRDALTDRDAEVAMLRASLQEVESLGRAADSALRDRLGDIAQLQSASATARADAIVAEARLGQATETLRRRDAELADALQRVSQVESRAQEAESRRVFLEDSLTARAEELAETQALVQRLSQERQRDQDVADAALADLREQLRAAEDSVRLLSEAQQELESLRAVQRDAERRRRELEEQLGPLHGRLVRAERRAVELDELTQSLTDQLARSHADLAAERARTDAWVSDRGQALEDEVRTVRAELEGQSREVAEQSARARSLTARVERLTEGLDRITTELAKTRAETERERQRRTTTEADLSQAQSQSSQLEARIQQLMTEAENAREIEQRRQSLNAVVAQERDGLREALAHVLVERDRVRAELEGIRASRSYRYGRRLTAPGRLFRRDSEDAEGAEDGVRGGRS